MKDVSDKCSDCGRYAKARNDFKDGLAYCGAHRDTIAPDAKTARYCKHRRDKED